MTMMRYYAAVMPVIAIPAYLLADNTVKGLIGAVCLPALFVLMSETNARMD